MSLIKIEVQRTRAVIRSQEPLTVGLRGVKVHFSFGQDWDNLNKTAVFRQGDVVRTVLNVQQEAAIPWEVLQEAGVPVEIGVFGFGTNKAIPTIWTTTQPVRPGADPNADPSAEPTPGLWEQMQSQLSTMKEVIGTCLVTVRKGDDGNDWADRSIDTISNAYRAGKTLMCYWLEHNLLLPLSDPDGGREFTFRTVAYLKEYSVKLKGEKVICTRKSLVEEAPVRSVNGQIGDVVLPASLTVTISEQSDGTYLADFGPDQIKKALEDHWIVACYWYDKNIMLSLSSFQPMGPYNFSAICDATEYHVLIHDIHDIECSETKLSNSPLVVTVTEQSDGKYTTDLSHDQLWEAYNAGRSMYCKHGNRILSLVVANKSQMVFECIYTDTLYKVAVGINTVTVTETPLATEAVSYAPQTLTPEQQAQAKQNLGIQEPVTVTVTEESDGTYTADMSLNQLYEVYQTGTILLCEYKGIIMNLVAAYPATVGFECIYVDKVYRVSVFKTRVELVVTPLVSSTEDAVLYTPQTLTTEQQAQARQNIGACDEAFVRNAILVYDTEAMALLGEDGDGQ